jgi:hypothetical protein
MSKNTGGARLGHAAGDTDIEKQASQLASDVKYKVRKSLSGQTNLNPAQVAKAYLSQLAKSPAPSTVKAMAKKKLTGGLKEEYNISQLAEDSVKSVFTKVFTEESVEKKYHIKVTDKKTGNSYTREATRTKISELRANPNIASVEMTSYGKDRDGDGKIESSSKEHAGVVHNAIQRKKGGVPDGKDTRKESVEEEVIYEKECGSCGSKITGKKVNNKKFINLKPTVESVEPGSNSKLSPADQKSLSKKKDILKKKLALQMQTMQAQKRGEIPLNYSEGCDQKTKSGETVPIEDPRSMPAKINLAKNKLRAMGLKMSYDMEGDVVNEEGADSLRDRRMERGGVDGNNRYKKPTSNTPNTFGKKKPAGGPSALERVKASITAKYGQGAIIDTKKK